MHAPSTYGGIFDYDAKSERLRTVNASLEDPAVWNDPKKAQELGKEKKSLEDIVLVLTRLNQEIEDNTELFEMEKLASPAIIIVGDVLLGLQKVAVLDTPAVALGS